jgi:hypothetical protein
MCLVIICIYNSWAVYLWNFFISNWLRSFKFCASVISGAGSNLSTKEHFVGAKSCLTVIFFNNIMENFTLNKVTDFFKVSDFMFVTFTHAWYWLFLYLQLLLWNKSRFSSVSTISCSPDEPNCIAFIHTFSVVNQAYYLTSSKIF